MPRRAILALGVTTEVRIFVALISLMVAAILFVCACPPFPSVGGLIDSSYPVLVTKFGAPSEAPPDLSLPQHLRAGRRYFWRRSRIVAVWTLEVEYPAAPFGPASEPYVTYPSAPPDPASRPYFAARGLDTGWNWIDWLLPHEAVARATVQVP